MLAAQESESPLQLPLVSRVGVHHSASGIVCLAEDAWKVALLVIRGLVQEVV